MQDRKQFHNAYGEKLLTEPQCQNWFARFRSGDFDLKDTPDSGRPTEVDDDKIKAIIGNNRCRTTREIAEKLNMSHACVERHLKQLGYVNKKLSYANYLEKKNILLLRSFAKKS